uniref:4-hydroxybenzoate polyprenyltransferase, mitochondrial n=1 Tax=Oryza punctata TaxID=4537 RepID=A0A0E0LUK6_ORYPU
MALFRAAAAAAAAADLLRCHRRAAAPRLPLSLSPSPTLYCPDGRPTPNPVDERRRGDLFAATLSSGCRRRWPRPRPLRLLLLLPVSSSCLGMGTLSMCSSYLSSSSAAAGGDDSSPPPPAPPPPPSWVDRWVLPRAARPYAMLARLDKPIGTWLLAWPSFWSITMAAMPGEMPDMRMLALFACGSVLIRGAGCTINDLLDRDIDRKVERTKSRPLASGVLTPTQGVGFLGFQLLLGLPILLQLNNFSQILGVFSLLLVFSYPLMKRYTYWPQAYLGLVFNWGALIGWAAMKGTIDPAIILPLYTAGICWTLVYDTIYAHQDKEDDLKVGVKSTALRFGDSTKPWISGFGATCIANLALSGYKADLAWPYYPFLVAASAHLAWQVSTVDLSDRLDCNRKFVSNKWFGALIFAGILCGRLVS